MAAGARAQPVSTPEATSQARQEPVHAADDSVAVLPLDIAGYLAARSLTSDDLAEHDVFREYSASLFVNKTAGRWLFHSEVNANTAPEWDSEGIHIIPRLSHLSLKLETASVNFNWRDSLQVQAGFLFVPTYWRTHRFQTTTLTVDEPLVDQAVFPTAFTGVMIHGDKYFDEGGIRYDIYGGSSQQATFEDAVVNADLMRSWSVGGKVVWHIPTRHLFDALDVGFLEHRKLSSDTSSTQIYGAELNVKSGPLTVLGEFSDASIGSSPSQTGYHRQGYYLQPSYRIAPPLFIVARFERLNRDSRYPDVNRMGRQSLGVTYRPISAFSIKVDVDRNEPQRGVLPSYWGLDAGLVYFFRVP